MPQLSLLPRAFSLFEALIATAAVALLWGMLLTTLALIDALNVALMLKRF